MITNARLRCSIFLLVLFAVLATLSSPHLFSEDNHSPNKQEKPFALLFGTVLDKDNRAVYGVKIAIHEAGRKKPHWEVMSDHQGEFGQRVPPGKADYVVTAEIKGKGPRPEVTVHVANDERVDFFLHLTE